MESAWAPLTLTGDLGFSAFGVETSRPLKGCHMRSWVGPYVVRSERPGFQLHRHTRRFTLRLILSLQGHHQGHQQNWSLGTDPICSVVLYFPHYNIVDSHSCDQYRISNELNVCRRACVHCVTDLATFLTDHRMSGLPIRAKYKHFKTICEHTFDNSPIDSIDNHPSKGLATVYNCHVFLCANSHSLSTHFRTGPSMS